MAEVEKKIRRRSSLFAFKPPQNEAPEEAPATVKSKPYSSAYVKKITEEIEQHEKIKEFISKLVTEEHEKRNTLKVIDDHSILNDAQKQFLNQLPNYNEYISIATEFNKKAEIYIEDVNNKVKEVNRKEEEIKKLSNAGFRKELDKFLI